MDKFEDLSDYGNLFSKMLNVILNIFLIVVQNVYDCKMQILADLQFMIFEQQLMEFVSHFAEGNPSLLVASSSP